MANYNMDIIRVEDTEANLPTTLIAGQLGFTTDTNKLGHLMIDGTTMQWFNSTESDWIIWDANGNGGVTTTSPQAKFDIYTSDDVKLALSDPDDSNGNNVLQYFIAGGNVKYRLGFYNDTIDYFAIKPEGANGLCMNGSGYVGLQTNDPQYPLDVNGEVQINNNLYLTALTPGSVCFIGAGSSSYQAISEDNSNFFWDESWGYLGLGTNAPGYLLELGSDSAGKPSTNTWTVTSDRRIKTNIIDFVKYGLADLLKLKPCEFEYNGEYGTVADGKKHVGYIAQEVEKIIPEMVSVNNKNLKTVNTHLLTFAIIEALRELNDRLKSLEKNVL